MLHTEISWEFSWKFDEIRLFFSYIYKLWKALCLVSKSLLVIQLSLWRKIKCKEENKGYISLSENKQCKDKWGNILFLKWRKWDLISINGNINIYHLDIMTSTNIISLLTKLKIRNISQCKREERRRLCLINMRTICKTRLNTIGKT